MLIQRAGINLCLFIHFFSFSFFFFWGGGGGGGLLCTYYIKQFLPIPRKWYSDVSPANNHYSLDVCILVCKF